MKYLINKSSIGILLSISFIIFVPFTMYGKGKPPKPTNVSAVEQDGRVEVTWNHNPDINYYEVYRSTDASSGYKKVGTAFDNQYFDEEVKPKILRKPTISSISDNHLDKIDITYQKLLIADQYYFYKVKAVSYMYSPNTSDHSNFDNVLFTDYLYSNSSIVMYKNLTNWKLAIRIWARNGLSK